MGVGRLRGSRVVRSMEGERHIITVEDHYAEGGIGEAAKNALATSPVPIRPLAVEKKPKSAKPEKPLDYEEIFQSAIVKKVKEFI